MRREWPAEAVDLQASVRAQLADRGGVDLARAAEEKPQLRADVVRPALASLGVLDLDPLADEAESAAAVLAVEACGEVVAPWPVARTLSVPTAQRETIEALYLVDGPLGHLEHADLFGRAVAVAATAGGAAINIEAAGPVNRSPLDPFGAPVVAGGGHVEPVAERAVLMSFVLDGFWTTGALRTATTQAAAYATTRHQFGKPIGSFGEIRWRLANMTVALDGLEELATWTWFQVHRDRANRADTLALRLGMLEAVDAVLRNGHQVFGAIGLCEEHDLTVIDRHLTPLLVRPTSPSRTAEQLLDAVNRSGFRGTFDVAPRAAPVASPDPV